MNGTEPNELAVFALTFGGEFYCALLVSFLTAGLAAIGYPAFVAPVRDRPRLCVRRRFVYWFGLLGFWSGGIAPLFDEGEAFVGALVGLWLGTVIGYVVGLFVGWYLDPTSE